MGLARSQYVKEGEEGVYPCFCRCVRRASLFVVDVVTNWDYTHRKEWIVERLKFLASIFAVDVCAFAVMTTHAHEILQTRPDIVASWLDWEVASRWLQICHRKPRFRCQCVREDGPSGFQTVNGKTNS
jgi:putative transposase